MGDSGRDRLAATEPDRSVLGGTMSGLQKWLLGLYVGLLIFCAGMVLISEVLAPVVRQALLPVAADGFKTVLVDRI